MCGGGGVCGCVCVCYCMQPCIEVSPWPTSRPGLECISFVMHFAYFALVVFNDE